jgi:hypothetical protein
MTVDKMTIYEIKVDLMTVTKWLGRIGS